MSDAPLSIGVENDGPDPLVFKSDLSYLKRELWSARESEFIRADSYTVYSWKDGWSFSRADHPVLGPLQGLTETREEAMQICSDDYAKVCRLQRWEKYMANYEPPSRGEKLETPASSLKEVGDADE